MVPAVTQLFEMFWYWTVADLMSRPVTPQAGEVACELLLGAGENVEVRVNGHNVKFDVRNMRGLQRRHGLEVTA